MKALAVIALVGLGLYLVARAWKPILLVLLDLFAGLGGWSEAFRARGHDVLTLDIDPRFGCDITADILTWDPDSIPPPDIVLASPPCEAFSTMSIGTHWGGGVRAYEPKTDAARLGIALVERTVDIISALRPTFFVIENPRDVLRNLPLALPDDRRTVWQCHVGREWAKPTDLWGGFPPSLDLPRECHNRHPDHAETCCCHDHNAAPRGSRTGTQGPKTAAQRAEIPYGLSFLVCEAAERDLENFCRASAFDPAWTIL